MLPKENWEFFTEEPDDFGDDWHRFPSGAIPKIESLANGDADGKVGVKLHSVRALTCVGRDWRQPLAEN